MLTYRAGNDFTGTDTFTYTVSDSRLPRHRVESRDGHTDRRRLHARLRGRGRLPCLTNDSARAHARGCSSTTEFDIRQSPGPDQRVTQPVYGTLSESDGTLIYTPNPDFNGVDSFIYTVADSGDPTIVSLPDARHPHGDRCDHGQQRFLLCVTGETIEFVPFFTYNDINRTGHA